jgi:hypothetical protein
MGCKEAKGSAFAAALSCLQQAAHVETLFYFGGAVGDRNLPP